MAQQPPKKLLLTSYTIYPFIKMMPPLNNAVSGKTHLGSTWAEWCLLLQLHNIEHDPLAVSLSKNMTSRLSMIQCIMNILVRIEQS